MLDAVKGANPAALGGWAIEQFLSKAGEAITNMPVAGAEAEPVVAEYVAARDRLLRSYEDNLGQIRDWVSQRRQEHEALEETIPQPVPSTADVDSPVFRYENFHAPEHAPASRPTTAPEVTAPVDLRPHRTRACGLLTGEQLAELDFPPQRIDGGTAEYGLREWSSEGSGPGQTVDP